MTLADVAALLMDVASEARSRGNDYEDEQAQTAAATIRRWMPVIDAAGGQADAQAEMTKTARIADEGGSPDDYDDAAWAAMDYETATHETEAAYRTATGGTDAEQD